MNIVYKAYNFLNIGVFFIFFPPFWFYTRLTGRYRDGINQRLGFYPKSLVNRISGSPKNMVTCGFGGGGERRSGDY